MVKKGIVVLLSLMLLLVCLAPPAFAAVEYKMICPNCATVQLQGSLTQHAYCAKCGCYLVTTSMGGGGSRGGGAGRLETPKKYYTAPGAGGGSSYNSGGTSYYSVMNTANKTLNYTTYNSTTNNYTTNNYTYNNYTYNNEYNYYTYNIENKNYYVTNNITYVTVSAPDGTQNEDGKDNYENTDIYYQLPDGRNSYNLTVDEIWGSYLTYNVTGCTRVPEDDGQTLGLWHLDGDLKDSSVNNGLYLLSSNSTTFVDVENEAIGFGSALSGTAISGTIGDLSALDSFTLEFKAYVASGNQQSNLYLPFEASYTYTLLDKYYFDLGLTQRTKAFSYNYICAVPSNQWNFISVCYDGTFFTVYVNGVLTASFLPFIPSSQTLYWSGGSGSVTISDPTKATTVFNKLSLVTGKFYISGNIKGTIDEVRLSNKVLYTGNYTYSQQPFDTNSVLVRPSDPLENDIVLMSNTPVADYRIGGVRPTYPVNGSAFVYVEDDVVQSVQQYQADGWYPVDAFIFYNGAWQPLKNFNLKSVQFVEDKTPTPTPTPGPGDPTPTPGPDDPDNPDNPGGGFWDKITGFFDRVWGFFVGIPTFFEGLISKLLDVADILDDFGPAVAAIYTWLPSEWQTVLNVGFSAVMGVSLLALFRRK